VRTGTPVRSRASDELPAETCRTRAQSRSLVGITEDIEGVGECDWGAGIQTRGVSPETSADRERSRGALTTSPNNGSLTGKAQERTVDFDKRKAESQSEMV